MIGLCEKNVILNIDNSGRKTARRRLSYGGQASHESKMGGVVIYWGIECPKNIS